MTFARPLGPLLPQVLLLTAMTGACASGAGWVLGPGGPVFFAGLAALAIAAAGYLGLQRWPALAGGDRQRRQPDTTQVNPAVTSFRELDTRMLERLEQAVHLSEASSLDMIERVTGLRGLSSRLMGYLKTAHEQSQVMQQEIERSGSIVSELARFVQQLPQQISEERAFMDQFVGQVRELSGITEIIRGMARQTEILSINAAIAAAQAGEDGRAFAVLAGEVRRLALQSNTSAQEIEQHIKALVETVQARSLGEGAQRLRDNETEAGRLLALTGKLDEGYLDMRQFYAMLLTAITEHNGALDAEVSGLLDTAQYQDIFKQIVDRLQPAFEQRSDVLAGLLSSPSAASAERAGLEQRAAELAREYMAREAEHRDLDGPNASAQGDGRGLQRIELF